MKPMATMFPRTLKVQEILRWRDRDLVKVLTGVRRCGKSTLLALTRDALTASGVPPCNIFSVDFESREGQAFQSVDDVWRALDSLPAVPGRKYVFLDEVQRLDRFENLVDALFADKSFDVYITGSNAWMLSGELATNLSGRYVEIPVQPLSFAEYLEGNPESDRQRAFLDYLRYGSFPYVRKLVEMDARADVGQYLDGILDTVLVRDVASRAKLTDTRTLRRIVAYLFDNVSNLTSVKRIADTLSAAGPKASYHAVESYVDSLCRAFLFRRCERLDVKGLAILRNGAKYYAADTGLRWRLNGNRSGDWGRLLENTVYLELLRRSPHVFAGQTRNGREVDFVTRDADSLAYYQVADSVDAPETLARELAALRDIHDNHPKFLLVGSPPLPANHDGIRQIPILDFLLSSP